MEFKIAARFEVDEYIESGGHGTIYSATDVETACEVAIKLEPLQSMDPQILHENDMYTILGQGGNQTTP